MKRVPLFSCLFALSMLLAGAPRARAEDAAKPKQNGYTVVVEAKVNKDGVPESIRLVSSEDTSTGDVLTKMAIAMAENTTFPPHLKDGKPVGFTATVPFFFPIEDDEGPNAQTTAKPIGKPGTAQKPVYPPDLLAKGIAGGVIFELVIDKQGNISRLTTLRASHPEFEQAAREAMKTWSFIPPQQNGQPIETRWRIAVVFETRTHMADVKYRIAPRPSLGAFIVAHDDTPAPAPEAAAAPGAPAQESVAAPAAQPAPTPAQPEAGK